MPVYPAYSSRQLEILSSTILKCSVTYGRVWQMAGLVVVVVGGVGFWVQNVVVGGHLYLILRVFVKSRRQIFRVFKSGWHLLDHSKTLTRLFSYTLIYILCKSTYH